MDHKGYRYIPIALFDAITFLCQSLPKRSAPTFLELLFGAMLTQNSFVTDAVLALILSGTGTSTTSGSTERATAEWIASLPEVRQQFTVYGKTQTVTTALL